MNESRAEELCRDVESCVIVVVAGVVVGVRDKQAACFAEQAETVEVA
jgi:hypothetical protein